LAHRQQTGEPGEARKNDRVIFGRQEVAVVVLRDADEISAAVLRALEAASDAERPGLERAMELIGGAAPVTEAHLRARWVRQRLSAIGIDDLSRTVAAVKALRESEPQLGLVQATMLVREAAALSTASAPADGAASGTP
jgi:hypothetical protein